MNQQEKRSIKEWVTIGFAISGIPAFFGALFIGVKIFWCVWLSDTSCWSHFP